MKVYRYLVSTVIFTLAIIGILAPGYFLSLYILGSTINIVLGTIVGTAILIGGFFVIVFVIAGSYEAFKHLHEWLWE